MVIMWSPELSFSARNLHAQAIAARAGAAVSPAALAQPVVNHRALDTVSAESRKAAADAASAQVEGTLLLMKAALLLACLLPSKHSTALARPIHAHGSTRRYR